MRWLDRNEQEISAVLGGVVLFGFVVVGLLVYSIFRNY